MLKIDIITLFPQMIENFLAESIVGRAREKKLVEINSINLRDYTNDKRKNVDDYAYGGSAGMVMMIEPIVNCIERLQQSESYDLIVYMSPDGQKLDQKMANRLSMNKRILILCGHYKGIDERVRQHFINMEISIGDYVLTGGELPACVLCDALVRLLPGAIGDETSALTDSFQDGLLSPPVYTRPANFRGMQVPDVLLSGNEKLIREWQMEQALLKTKERRPDLLDDDNSLFPGEKN